MSEPPVSEPSAGTPDAEPELVVLVDEHGDPIGTEEKARVHTENTPLHLAFSVHLIAPDGHVLLTRRSLAKRTWPGVWTNSLCGHPGPGERMAEAILRRARDELNLEPAWLSAPTILLPDFRYQAVDASGVAENEICPVFVVRLLVDRHELPSPNPSEVADLTWVRGEDLVTAVQAVPAMFSPWLRGHIDDARARHALTGSNLLG